jgi:hypothetical protein
MSKITVSRWAATYNRSRRTANPSEEQILEEVARDIEDTFKESGQTLKGFTSCFMFFLCNSLIQLEGVDGARREIDSFTKWSKFSFEEFVR